MKIELEEGERLFAVVKGKIFDVEIVDLLNGLIRWEVLVQFKELKDGKRIHINEVTFYGADDRYSIRSFNLGAIKIMANHDKMTITYELSLKDWQSIKHYYLKEEGR